jgi:glycosyltransferase involved in cell wall biosynthesis
MAPELVSCVIPVYNAERYLGETLDSVLAQTYRPFEVIVVDDGSTDSTPDIVAAHADRIRCLRQANAGAAAARNRGIEAAQSEFIALGDGDDLWHPARLDRQMARFAERPELDMCFPHVESFWSPDLSDLEDNYNDPRAGTILPAAVTMAMVARRALFEQIGDFDTAYRISDDQDWYLRVVEGGAVIEVLPDVLLKRRLYVSNITRLEAARCGLELAEIVKRSLDRRRRESGGRPRLLDMPEAHVGI